MTDILDHGSITLVSSMGTDQTIVDAARVSIAGLNVKPTSTNERLIGYLMRNEHMTPFEVVRFMFHVKCPIFVARQWMRHRAGSFNEVSARYSEMVDEFYVPSFERMIHGGQSTDNKQGSGTLLDARVNDESRAIMAGSFECAMGEYKALLGMGVARELARTVLPVSLYTQFMWSVDLRNLLHFVRLRADGHAQWEIRQYAEAILPMIEETCPLALEAWKEKQK